MRIGVDFDNTLACYDALFARLAMEQGLLDQAPRGGKRGVRDAVRERPEGEMAWRRLQALAYGRDMTRATPFAGALDTLRRWRSRGADIFVVSHKTRVSPDDPDAVDLRAAALDWLAAQGLVGRTGAPIRPSDVHFNATRAEKLACIAGLGCDLFIDDLEEVFRELAFPTGTVAILFDPHGTAVDDGPWHRVGAWSELAAMEVSGAAA